MVVTGGGVYRGYNFKAVHCNIIVEPHIVIAVLLHLRGIQINFFVVYSW